MVRGVSLVYGVWLVRSVWRVWRVCVCGVCNFLFWQIYSFEFLPSLRGATFIIFDHVRLLMRH